YVFTIAKFLVSSGPGYSAYMARVLKLDSAGNIVWQRNFPLGLGGHSRVNAALPTADGGYFMVGEAGSHAWVAKLDSVGHVVWQRGFGKGYGDSLASAESTSDGGFIAAGRIASTTTVASDLFLLKLGPDGAIPGCSLTVPTSIAEAASTTTGTSDGTV